MGTTAIARKKIPFVLKFPAAHERAGQDAEYPGVCRSCGSAVVRSQVNPEYLDSIGLDLAEKFKAELCVVSRTSGSVFWPRNCASCDRRGGA